MKKTLLIIFMLFFVVSNLSGAPFDWKKYSGDSIRVLGLKFYYTNLIKKRLNEFEDLTGIKVVLETYPEDRFRQKMVVELAGGSTSIDAFTTGTAYEGRKFYVSGWYEYLDNYISDSSITNPNWDINDFVPSVWNAQVYEGNRVSIPLNAVTWVLFYRKDLYQKYNLTIPKTFNDLEKNVSILNKDNIHGYVGRGKRTQAVPSYSILLHAFGGKWLNDKRKAAFNSKAGIDALDFYVKLMKNYANPGSAENNWYDVLSLLQQGKAAHIIDTNAWIGAVSNPEKSKVGDLLGFAPIPVGPSGTPVSDLWSWNMAISSMSKKKKQAWYFIQWVTGKEFQKFIQLNKFPSSRLSAWQSSEFAKIANKEWLDSTMTSFKYASPIAHPVVVEIHQIEDVIGSAIVDSILGKKSSKRALDDAAKEVNNILESTE